MIGNPYLGTRWTIYDGASSVPGATLEFFEAGGAITPKNVSTTSDLLTLTSSVTADENGQVQVWLLDGDYFIRATNPSGGTIFTSDDVNISLSGSTVTASTIRATNTDTLTLTSTDHAFQIGPTSENNLRIDSNRLQTVTNIGTAANILFNPLGGNVVIGGTTTGMSNLFCEVAAQASIQARLSSATTTLDLNPDGGAVTVNGTDLDNLYMPVSTTGSFTPTVLGGNDLPTHDVNYEVFGNLVVWHIEAVSETVPSSAVLGWNSTPVPASIRPTSAMNLAGIGLNNGNEVPIHIQIATNGSVDFYMLQQSSGEFGNHWENSTGSKGLPHQTIMYLKNT